MRFYHYAIIHLIIFFSNAICDFKIEDCGVNFDELLNGQRGVKPPNRAPINLKSSRNNKTDNSTHNRLEHTKRLEESIYIYLFINGINNLDYLSNVFEFQFSLIELWNGVNLNLKSSTQIDPILIEDTASIEKQYPTFDVDETDYNEHHATSPIDLSSKERTFKNYYYISSERLLIKTSRLALQSRCLVSMQNFPFIDQPCNLNIRRSKFLPPGTNFTICNMNKFINKQFDFNKFNVEVTSLNRLCDKLNRIERAVLRPRTCFRLLITFRSNKRLFLIYFLITFVLLVISYLSLWVPIYNHTSRIALLTMPIIGQYLFDKILLKNDQIMFKESTSLHIWHLATMLYIGFHFFCYILAFYSLERVKRLVEKTDIGYLGYMLKSANLVQDENAFTNQLHNFDRARKYTAKEDEPKKANIPTILPLKSTSFDKIGSNLSKSVLDAKAPKIPKLDPLKPTEDLASDSLKESLKDQAKDAATIQTKNSKIIAFKTDLVAKSVSPPSSRELAIQLRPKKVSPVSNKLKINLKSEIGSQIQTIKFQPNLKTSELRDTPKSVPSNSPLAMSLKKELDELKRDLTTAQNDLNTNRFKINKRKKKTLQVLNNILSFKNPNKGQFKKKKIVSRFISSSKLRKIEFISLIPSDRYARFISPISFAIFFYFYALHFIF